MVRMRRSELLRDVWGHYKREEVAVAIDRGVSTLWSVESGTSSLRIKQIKRASTRLKINFERLCRAAAATEAAAEKRRKRA